jgi:hypothetical protein
LWQTLRQGLPGAQWSRIESTAGSGVPDVNGFMNGVELWFELKMMKGNRLEFRQSQVAWIGRRLKLGATNVFVLARKDDELRLYVPSIVLLPPVRVEDKALWIEPGAPALTLRKPFDWAGLWRHCVALAQGRVGCRSNSSGEG